MLKEVELYPSGNVVCEGIHEDVGWIIGTSRNVTAESNFPKRLAPDGTIDWTFAPATGYSLCTAGGLKYDYEADRAWFAVNQSGGSPARTVACCQLSDGVSVYDGGQSIGTNPAALIVDADDDACLVTRNNSSLMYKSAASTGVADSAWQPQPVESYRVSAAMSGGRSLWTTGGTDGFRSFPHPIDNGDDPDWIVVAADLGLGSLNMATSKKTIAADTFGTGWWVTAGATSSYKAWHITLDGTVDVTIDTEPDWTAAGSGTMVPACDKYGDVYLGRLNSGVGGGYSVARYKPDGTLVWVIDDVFETVGSGGVIDMGVDGEGHILVCSAEGVGTIIEQV